MKAGALKVWHNSQFGSEAFEVEVDTVSEAKQILRILADYDLYLGDKITANAQGLLEFDGKEWLEWEDPQGRHIDELPIR